MELNRQSITNINFKDFTNAPRRKFFHADVILIEKSYYTAPPVLYQLRGDEAWLENLVENVHRQGITPMHNDVFTLIGEVVFLDKKNKKVILGNQDAISY